MKIMRNGDKMAQNQPYVLVNMYTGFQDILKTLLSGRDEQFVGILTKDYEVASRYQYHLWVEILDDGKP